MTKRRMGRYGLMGFMLIGLVSVAVFIVLQHRVNAIPENGQPSQNTAASIDLPTLDGQMVALPGDVGQITVAYSIALGCGDCVPGAKTLARLQPDYAGRGVRFIAIASDPGATPESLQPFLQAVGKNQLTWALDKDQKFTYLYQIDALNIVILFDKQGHEAYRAHLSSTDTEFRAALDKLLVSRS